jgi:hypothetical protein
VPPGAALYTEVSWMATQGISVGWRESDGTRTFRPGAAASRDMMAAFFYRLAGSPAYTPGASPFTDVTPQTPFFKEISWLASQGISTGWTEADGTRTYRPTLAVNRDQVAAFVYRFAGSPAYTPGVSPFADISPQTAFFKEISWLASQGISTGWTEADGTRTYRSALPVNRDQVAAFLYRYNNAFPA